MAAMPVGVSMLVYIDSELAEKRSTSLGISLISFKS